MAQLQVVHGEWINLERPGGQVFFVGGGTVAYKGAGPSDGFKGTSPKNPLATIDGTAGAFAKVVAGRGDTIVILPGNVTITAAIAFDTTDVTLTGIADGSSILPSSITSSLSSSADAINVTAANATIENLHFPASTAATTSRIDVGAAGCTIRHNTFLCGANDVETITLPAAGDDCLIEGNRFSVTANGPDAAIEIEAAGVNGLTVKNNVFHGGNDTNGWDTGAVNSTVAHTDCWITGNATTSGPGIIFSGAATGMISDNDIGYVDGSSGSLLDPGSCTCTRNFEMDAIDEKGREFPTTEVA